MSPTKLLVVALAWAVLSAPARACDSPQPADPKPDAEKSQWKTVGIPLVSLDADEAATTLRKLVPTETGIVIVKVPLFNAILAGGTDKELLTIRQMLKLF
jgi:hypothetical protein